jgi:uncharacterized membrane protein YbjE (DUF340 family)
MQDIIIILACISLGMALGWLQRANRPLLKLADTSSLYAVYGLLFVLGVRLGSDAVLLETLPLLGTRALLIAVFCTAGSVMAIAPIGKRFTAPFAQPAGNAERIARTERSGGPSPLWGSMRILTAFSLGVLLAVLEYTPVWMSDSTLAAYALYLLVFAVGIGLGANLRAFRILRDLHIKILAVPTLIVAGSGLGAAAASLALPGMALHDSLCVGAGLGYYSLSSILIENAGNSSLASTALLANILREVLAILAAPALARYCGRLSTVAAAGATAMDTTLPVIARFSGEGAAVIAVFSGMTLTLLVPFLVTAALQWQ